MDTGGLGFGGIGWGQMTGNPLRLAVVGLTHAHVGWALDAARKRGDIEIVGVWEPDRALFDRYAGDFAVDGELWSEDLGAMLDRTRPEAASVMTSTRLHVAAVEALAKRKIAALVEKPLAINEHEAQRMIGYAAERGSLVLTNYETSWYASVREAARMVRAGELGTLRRLVFRTGHPGPVEIGCGPEFLSWLCTVEENGGGPIMDFGCYGVAIALWMMGGREPDTVQAMAVRTKPEVYPDVEDDSTILLGWDGGPSVVIQASWNWTHDDKDMDVFCEHGGAHCGKRNDLTVRGPDQPAKKFTPPGMTGATADMWTYLREATRGTAEIDPLSSLELNVAVVRVLDRARRAAGLPVPG